MSPLVYNTEYCKMSITASQSPRWRLELLVWSKQLSKAQTYSIYNDMKQRKAANIQIGEY